MSHQRPTRPKRPQHPIGGRNTLGGLALGVGPKPKRPKRPKR